MSTSNQKEIQQLLESGRRLEGLMAQIYRELARLHAGNPAIAALWRKMAHEEDNHGQQYNLGIVTRGEMIKASIVELPEMDTAVNQTSAYLESIKVAPPTIEDALRATLYIEETVRNLHMDCAMIFKAASHGRLFTAMMAADDGHVEGLRQTLKDYVAGNTE